MSQPVLLVVESEEERALLFEITARPEYGLADAERRIVAALRFLLMSGPDHLDLAEIGRAEGAGDGQVIAVAELIRRHLAAVKAGPDIVKARIAFDVLARLNRSMPWE